MTTNQDWLTPEAQAVIARAEAMIPKLRERAVAADDAGQVPKETVAEMKEAGLFRVLQQKKWGGYEMDPRVFAQVQMALPGTAVPAASALAEANLRKLRLFTVTPPVMGAARLRGASAGDRVHAPSSDSPPPAPRGRHR